MWCWDNRRTIRWTTGVGWVTGTTTTVPSTMCERVGLTPPQVSEQRLALYHELVHRFLLPKFGPLRRFRAQIGAHSYERIAFLQYLEEALAEGFAQFKFNGFKQGFATGIKFPIENGYVIISQLQGEGALVGNIMIDGSLYRVFISNSSSQKEIQKGIRNDRRISNRKR